MCTCSPSPLSFSGVLFHFLLFLADSPFFFLLSWFCVCSKGFLFCSMVFTPTKGIFMDLLCVALCFTFSLSLSVFLCLSLLFFPCFLPFCFGHFCFWNSFFLLVLFACFFSVLLWFFSFCCLQSKYFICFCWPSSVFLLFLFFVLLALLFDIL